MNFLAVESLLMQSLGEMQQESCEEWNRNWLL